MVGGSKDVKGAGGVKEEAVTSVQLTVNGVVYEVGPEVSPHTHLIDYLRNELHLTGAKSVCREGGCGACTVVATAPDPEHTGETKTFSVNACRQLLFACNGWEVETVEHLGDRFEGYHPLQEALARLYGTQCGSCSPGMVMTMYGQQKSSGSLTMSQVEGALDGNLCRCTGYRPIMDAFKSQAVDASQKLKDRLPDIEDAYKAKGCCKNKGKGKCQSACGGAKSAKCAKKQGMMVRADGSQWYQPTTLQGIYDVINSLAAGETYQLVVGNTGEGVYRSNTTPAAYIVTAGVRELYDIEGSATSLKLGACVNIGRAIETFKTAEFAEGFQYLEALANHWSVVANTATRNVGSIAGNLMLKRQHLEFPSDIFLTLLGAGATLTLGTAADGTTTQVTLEEFLTTDMSGRIILSITLPQLSLNTQMHSYKITPRAVNAHAYVNAVFVFEVDTSADFTVTSKPVILYGGINPSFTHATQTEDFLNGRSLLEANLAAQAAGVLSLELVPDSQPQDASPEYRSSLAQALLYKAIISILGGAVNSELVSGGSLITRPLSSGQQIFTENSEMFPVGKPIPKVESLPQVSGEALFMNDAPALPGELHGYIIQSTVGRATVTSIDTSQALAAEGVVAVVTAADIPGVNSFIADSGVYPEEVFASTEVKYAGQALGLVVATSYSAAQAAAALVVVQYSDVQTPVLTIQQAQAEGWVYPDAEPLTMGDVEAGFAASAHTITAEFSLGGQHHMPLEPVSARVAPTEDGYDVLDTTIWPAESQSVVAQVLNVDASSVNVSVRRIGGSFGGKISRSHMVSAAAAVGAWKAHKPVKIALDMKTFMTLIGGREPYYSKYKVGIDAEGKLLAVEEEIICDTGCTANDVAASLAAAWMSSVYYCPNWQITSMYAITNTPCNTFMRAPGIIEGLSTMETIMDHVAGYLGKDPLEVRELNLTEAGDQRPGFLPVDKNIFKDDILPLLKTSADFEARKLEVAAFNDANRWRKRGIALVPSCFNLSYNVTFRFGGLINIYSHDGTVAITHGGIDMGQGINTKVSQIAAYILSVPLETVKVKATSTTSNANSSHQGATICSDIVCLGVKQACEILAARIADFKATLPDGGADLTWPELLKKCVSSDIDISERFWTKQGEYPADYDVYGGAIVEVELDVLTGTFLIRRVDAIEDCGQSMSPYVDLGQVEGALAMSMGLHTCEEVKYDPTTGQKLTAGTWYYKPQSALDIPVDLRVTLLPNSANTSGVLRAKAVGEPPMCLGFGVVMALRQAITAARTLAGNTDWFDISTPLTVEKIQQLCLVDASQFVTV